MAEGEPGKKLSQADSRMEALEFLRLGGAGRVGRVAGRAGVGARPWPPPRHAAAAAGDARAVPLSPPGHDLALSGPGTRLPPRGEVHLLRVHVPDGEDRGHGLMESSDVEVRTRRPAAPQHPPGHVPRERPHVRRLPHLQRHPAQAAPPREVAPPLGLPGPRAGRPATSTGGGARLHGADGVGRAPLLGAPHHAGQERQGVRNAAQRKILDELGIPAEDAPIDQFTPVGRMLYMAPSDGKWSKHELTHMLFIVRDVKLQPNPDEVADVKYVNCEQLMELIRKADAGEDGVKLSPWFRFIADNFLMGWWEHVEKGTLGEAADRKGHVGLSCAHTRTSLNKQQEIDDWWWCNKEFKLKSTLLVMQNK